MGKKKRDTNKPVLGVTDFMLATARTCGARRRLLDKFKDGELIGLVWFSRVPDLFKHAPTPSDEFLFDEFNLFVAAFWSAYRRHPGEALQIIGKIRAREPDAAVLAMKMALRENPDITNARLAARMSELCGTNLMDLETVKKRRQRLETAARQSQVAVELIPVRGRKHPKGGSRKGTTFKA